MLVVSVIQRPKNVTLHEFAGLRHIITGIFKTNIFVHYAQNWLYMKYFSVVCE